MILHIVVDDKFIDCAYHVFEETNPHNNVYLIVGEKRDFVYIKKTPLEFISIQEFLSKSFAKSLVKYDMVIFHSMTNQNLKIIDNIPDEVKLVWIGWGFDYYDLITNGEESKLYLPLTKSLFDKNTKGYLNSIVKKIRTEIIDKFIWKKKGKSEIINRIDYFSPVLYEDYELIKKVLPNFKPKYISWNYGNLEDDLIKGFENCTISGNNILIGNSATYENNHLDSFKILSTIRIDDRMIISPVSYGNPIYRKNIIEYGKSYWGDQFVPVVDFMPIEKYVNLISSCSIVIMNHIRQQAMGNIIIMMYLGAKIFLNNESPAYHFFKKRGANIFTIIELGSEINTRLNDSQIEHNRSILRNYWDRKTMFTKTRELLNTVSENQEVK